jgi:FSR family fosmidomycin resistance protein-like MFS transporter
MDFRAPGADPGGKAEMNRTAVFRNISVYSVSHALVDAACVATLFAAASSGGDESQTLFQLILIYNVLAFSTQPVFGLLADKYKTPVLSAVVGILLVAVSTLLVPAPFWAAILAGLGNALFHIGGGITSLNLARGKAALPGIFVAPGALGLTVGLWIGKGGGFIAWPFILLLLVFAVIILMLPRPEPAAPRKFSGNLKWFEPVILLLLVSIAIRSMVGLSLVFPWKSDPFLLVVLTMAVVLGKALGGILGDRFGWTAVAVSGLVLSAPMLAFFSDIPAAAIAGIFLFNLSMPITLIGVAGMLPANPGFAFGLTTLALILGAGPAFTQLRGWSNDPMIIFAAILVSIAALFGGLRLYAVHFKDIIPIHPLRAPSGEKAARRQI